MAKQIQSITDLIPDSANANKGTERGRYAVEASLRETGAGRSIVVDRDGRIIAGNKTLEAWADISGEIEIVKTDGKKLIVVQREDLDLSDVEGLARKLAYYDNRAGQLGLEWDAEQLFSDLNAGVDLSGMFFDDEIADILATIEGYEAPTAGEDPGADVSKADELQAVWNVQPGDLWQLGEHRLICGDCTDEATVARVMGGEKAALIFSDPPYNYASENEIYGADVSVSMAGLKAATWDQDFDLRPALDVLPLSDDVAVYLCSSHHLAPTIWGWMKTWADHFSWCVWNKPNPMPSLSKRHWTWNAELIPYATRGKHVFNFPVDGHALCVWTFNKHKETEHPTEKPVEVPLHAIAHSSKPGDIVFDGFSVSGTTIIACEQLGRKCRAVELHPPYVSVALQRWADMTGKTPVKLTN